MKNNNMRIKHFKEGSTCVLNCSLRQLEAHLEAISLTFIGKGGILQPGAGGRSRVK